MACRNSVLQRHTNDRTRVLCVPSFILVFLKFVVDQYGRIINVCQSYIINLVYIALLPVQVSNLNLAKFRMLYY